MSTIAASAVIYDYIVIGAGSGGLASARRAASLGARVAIVEQGSIGGTCVNRGCIPKKLMFNAAELAHHLRLFPHYGFGSVGLRPLTPTMMAAEIESLLEAPVMLARQHAQFCDGTISTKRGKKRKGRDIHIPDGKQLLDHAVTPLQRQLLVDPDLEIQVIFNWNALKAARDDYIRRLHAIYLASLEREQIAHFPNEHGRITAPGQVQLAASGQILQAKHILIATGAMPVMPKNIPGCELAINSDDFFDLKDQPKRVGIVGGGYIGVELAGILHSLGSQVHLWCRKERLLNRGHFDPLMSEMLHEDMIQSGIFLQLNTTVVSIEKSPAEKGTASCLAVTLHVVKPGETATSTVRANVDAVIMCTGRSPNLDDLGVALKTTPQGLIVVNDKQETSEPCIYAVGDITTQTHLTPVAVVAGRSLAERLFSKEAQGHHVVDLSLVPSVVFSHPPIGMIGLSEMEAKEKYGQENVQCHVARFTNLFYGLVPPGHRDRHWTVYKVITTGPEERVVGLHLFGQHSDEILQGFAVAMGMGMKKADLDRTIAIHPTSAEELVTLK